MVFKKLNLSLKLTLSFGGLFTVIVIAAGISTVAYVRGVVGTMIEAHLESVADAVAAVANTSYEMTRDRVARGIEVADAMLRDRVDTGRGTQEVQAVDQVTQEKRTVRIPPLEIDGSPVYGKTAFVDGVTELLGGTATVFQLIPQGLLRVATTVKKADGSRAVGTYIPSDSPVCQAVLKGATYLGRAYVVNDWYITAYKPIRNARREIVGAVYVGVSQADLPTLREKIASLKIGQSGYVQIFDLEGRQVIHKDSALEGKVRDTPQHKRMIGMKSGSLTMPQASSTNGKQGEMTLYHFVEIPQMQWILCVNQYESEVYAPVTTLTALVAGATLLAAVLSVVLSLLMSMSITKPVGRILGYLSRLEKGDLTVKPETASTDEIGRINRSMETMAATLSALVHSIKEANRGLEATGADLARDVEKTAKESVRIARLAESTRDSVSEQAASITESSAEVERIAKSIGTLDEKIEGQVAAIVESSASIEEMVGNIASVAKNVQMISDSVAELVTSSGDGKTRLVAVDEQIKEMAKESEILVETNSVIANIARQTNLLSMNAAIEAAHAGEAGKGFSVVADEIRKLAEMAAAQARESDVQLKSITARIGQVVDSSVAAGASFESVLEKIGVVNRLQQEIREAMTEQNEGSKQILEALQSMNGLTQEIKDGSSGMKEAGATVLEEMKRLIGISQAIQDTMHQVSEGTKEITGAMETVGRLTGRTQDSIRKVVEETNRFTVAGEEDREDVEAAAEAVEEA